MAKKLSTAGLRRLIKEEIQLLREYEQAVFRRDNETWLRDDEGNESYIDNDPDSWNLFSDGDAAPYEGRRGGYGNSQSDWESEWSRDRWQ